MFRIAVIGAGNMGGALARGWARAFGGGNVIVANPSKGKLDRLKEEFPDINVTTDNRVAVDRADVVVLAVKPWKIEGVVGQLQDLLANSEKLTVSVVAGVTADDLSEMIGGSQHRPAVVYCIPNTPVAVGQGMIFYCGSGIDDHHRELLTEMFMPLGRSLEVEPRQMGAGMAVASCGIAYAMRYIRAAVEGGVELGLTPAQTQEAVMQTLVGSVELLRANATHPEQEIDRVTTPGGITIRGLNAMEEAGFSASVIKGLQSSKI
ncbi:MAG: pyrroline-5-carboxylate reductase [Barnesiella sp.]|nr:pyrroline-5-carboxylate reductase [Barnesiella sp.]